MKYIKNIFKAIVFIIIATNLSAFELTIFHTNDIHGRVESDESTIGYAKMTTVVNDAKERGENVLFLDAGDNFHGTVLVNLAKGDLSVDILNKVKIDAMTLGNHDFNYGFERLLHLKKRANFKMLAANVIDHKGQYPFERNMIKEFRGFKVGIFGLATPETSYKTSPKNVEDLIFLDPRKVAQDQVNELKIKGADFIIALVHLGIDQSTRLEERSSYLSQVAGIDLIIDGHSHTVLPQGEKLRNALIVQTGSHGANLGKVVVKLNKDSTEMKSTLIPNADFSSVISDQGVLKVINKYKAKQDKEFAKVVASIPIALQGQREYVRSQETNLGDLITDSYKEATGADVAIMNGGGIRDSLEVGEVTYKDILRVLPFVDTLTTVRVSGQRLKDALEHSVSQLPGVNGGFLQVSGISFSVDVKAPLGKRVSDIKVGSKALNVKTQYTIAMPDFMAIGGDGYNMFGKENIIGNEEFMNDVFAKYLQAIDTTKLNEYTFNNRINIKGK